MKRFLAGMATMLVLVVVTGLVAASRLGSLGTTTPHAVPMGPGVSPSAPPTDLGPDETWLGDVDLTSSALVTPDGPLRDVHATGTNVRVTTTGLRVGAVTLVATLPFEVAAEQVGHDVRLYDAGGGLAGVARTATVLGQDLTIRATGKVSAAAGDLLIEPQTIDVGMPGFVNDALSGVVRELVTVRQSIQGLPPGLRLTAVTVGANGFRATLTGTDVTIAGRGG